MARTHTRRVLIGLALSALVVAGGFRLYWLYHAYKARAPREVTDWIRAQAIPLDTPEAGHGFADMEPLRKVVGVARIVALGEATHGTREFFQLKHRMLEFLVSKMGFTVFAIEANLPECLAVNDYVLTGRGDPARALAGTYFWTWNTEEVLEMIRWMRRYNEDPRHERKVKFYGFDMQIPPLAAKRVLAYFKKVDTQYALRAKKILAPLANDFVAREYLNLPKETQSATAAGVAEILKRFEKKKASYIRRSSGQEWSMARQNARIVGWAEEMGRRYPVSGVIRDRSMAENVKWILENEGSGAKIVLWAHNYHVSAEGWGAGPMCSHLRQTFGEQMAVFGFSFSQGSFQAREFPLASGRGLRPFTVGPPPDGSLDATLALAGQPLYALDLRTLPKSGPVADWFLAPHASRSIGAFYNEAESDSFLQPTAAAKNYDAILFVEKTTAARPTPFGRVPPWPFERGSIPINLDFEQGELGQVPAGWRMPEGCSQAGYRAVVSDAQPKQGNHCVLMDRTGERYVDGFGKLAQEFDAQPYRGKCVRLRAWVRAEVKGEGNEAYLSLEADREKEQPFPAIAFPPNALGRPIVASEWHQYEITGDIALGADRISLGLALVGEGRAWLDGVVFEIVGNAQPVRP